MRTKRVGLERCQNKQDDNSRCKQAHHGRTWLHRTDVIHMQLVSLFHVRIHDDGRVLTEMSALLVKGSPRKELGTPPM